MSIQYINNITLLFILFIGNIFIKNYNFYFLLVYIFLIIYHIHIFLLLYQKYNILPFSITNYICVTFLLFIIIYFFICDSNPFFCVIVFYSFFPNFIKAVLIIMIHSYTMNLYFNNIYKNNILINSSTEEIINKNINSEFNSPSYFLSNIFNYIKTKKKFKNFLILEPEMEKFFPTKFYI